MLKIKEKMRDLKLRMVKYLTPISYLEYSTKMLFILKIRQLRLLSYLVMGVNLVMLALALLSSKIINPVSIIISTFLTHIMYSIFIMWRKRIKGIRKKEKLPDIQVKPLVIKDIPVPDTLKKFINKNNKK